MDSGSYPLNQTIPPFASGDPMTCPPTFTWYVVAARALDAEKTKTNNDRIEMIARTSAVAPLASEPSPPLPRATGIPAFTLDRTGQVPRVPAGRRATRGPAAL